MPFLFTHVEYCNMHFVYGYCDCNASAAVNEYRRRYPERRIPSKHVFTHVEQSLRDNGCLPSFALHSERGIVRTINARENILDTVKRSPRLSTRHTASRVGLQEFDHKNIVMRVSLSVEARLALTLRFLATGRDLEDIKFSVTILHQQILKLLSKNVRCLCSPGLHEGKSNIKMFYSNCFYCTV